MTLAVPLSVLRSRREKTDPAVKRKKKLHQPPEEIRQALALPPHKRREWENYWGGWGTGTYFGRSVKRKPIENHFENPRDYPWLR
jgi:hypothetical protein